MGKLDQSDAPCTLQASLEAEFLHLYPFEPELRNEDTPEKRERELRDKVHALDDDQAPWGLCLSGGGIRSATFGLGVLQALAVRGLLRRFSYLSTVSGGGYIGSWLSRWIAAAEGKVEDVEKLLAGGVAGKGEPDQVRQLRAYSNYLSPEGGLSADFFTLVSTVLRNLLLNWCVLLPLIGACLLLPYLYLWLLLADPGPMGAVLAIAAAAGLLASGIAYVVLDLPKSPVAHQQQQTTLRPVASFGAKCFLPIAVAAVLLSLGLHWGFPSKGRIDWNIAAWFALLGAVIHLAGCLAGTFLKCRRAGVLCAETLQFTSGSRGSVIVNLVFILFSGSVGGLVLFYVTQWSHGSLGGDESQLLYATVVVPALMMSFWFATVVYVALIRTQSSEDEREWWARSGGWWIRGALFWLAGFAVVIYLPQWALGMLPQARAGLAGVAAGGGLWGVVVGLVGYWSKNGGAVMNRARGLAAMIGARLLDLAAVAFILVLLTGFCLGLSWGLGKTQENVFGKPKSQHPIAVHAISVVEAAQATEAAARSLALLLQAGDALCKISPKADAKEKACDALIDAANVVSSSADALTEILRDAAGGTQDRVRAAEAVARAIQTTTAVAGSVARYDEAAKMAIAGALDGLSRAVASSGLHGLGRNGTSSGSEYAKRITASGWLPFPLFAMLVIVGLFFSWIVGANTFSLHSMYGNRLVRAYFGAARAGEVRHPHWFTGFDSADNVAMKSICGRDGNGRPRLFHVLNLALNMVAPSGDRLEWQQRKAAPFSVTPLHSGSPVLGYVASERYAGARGWGISLARAMTISGAAASPNMGYHSSSAVAFVMTLFNARLGWWLPNPKCGERRLEDQRDPGMYSLWLWLNEALALANDRLRYVHLSDGGHFENLALYEMVRRRCRRILVVDASADPSFGYDDLQNAIHKIRVDFGISIEFPMGSFDGRRSFVMGWIRYSEVDGNVKDGRICYLKPVLVGDEPLDVRRYAALSRERDRSACFPHQTTADQFFDETQFESYRMLGYHMTMKAFKESQWPTGSDRPLAGPQSADASRMPAGIAEPSAAGGSLFSRMAESVRSMSDGAGLASAIAIGGVLGVSGTVLLKDAIVTLKPGAEISISKASLDSLGAIRIPIVAAGDGKTQDLKLLEDQLKEISGQLKSIVEKKESAATEVGNLNNSVTKLESRVLELEKLNASDAKNLKDVIVSLKNEVYNASGALRTWTDTKNLEHLKAINEHLDEILKSVREAPPRRNIRGIEGGGR